MITHRFPSSKPRRRSTAFAGGDTGKVMFAP